MTEDEARNQLVERFGMNDVDRVAAFLTMVSTENSSQNLVAPSTLATIWTRHALDSAQLLFHVERSSGRWLDIGTGGGFPGIVIALLSDHAVTMVEPRKRRAEFLQACVDRLNIANATVLTAKVEAVAGRFATISARAVASVEKLLQAAAHCATSDTRWILPRGRMGSGELAALQRDQRRVFHVEQSITDPESSILIVNTKEGRA